MRLHLRVPNDGEKKAPYDIDLETVGYFDLIAEYPAHEREDIARVNGASLLFGVLREVLCSLSARFPQGLIVLPGVNFLDLKSNALPESGSTQNISTSVDADRRAASKEPRDKAH